MRQPLIQAPKSSAGRSFAGVAVSLLLLSAAFVVVFHDVDFSDAAFFQTEEKLGVKVDSSTKTFVQPEPVYHSPPVSPEEVKVGDEGPQDAIDTQNPVGKRVISENEDADRNSGEKPVGVVLESMAVMGMLVGATTYNCDHVNYPTDGKIDEDAKHWTDEVVKDFFGEIKGAFTDPENAAYTVINDEVTGSTDGSPEMTISGLLADQYTNHIDVDGSATPIAAVEPFLEDAQHHIGEYAAQQIASYGDGMPNPMTIFSALMNVIIDKTIGANPEYAMWKFWLKQVVKGISIAVNVAVFGTNPVIAGLLAGAILLWSFAKEEFPKDSWGTSLKKWFGGLTSEATAFTEAYVPKVVKEGLLYIIQLAVQLISYLYNGVKENANNLYDWIKPRIETSDWYLMLTTVAHGVKNGWNWATAIASHNFCHFRGQLSYAGMMKNKKKLEKKYQEVRNWWNNKDHVDDWATWNCRSRCLYTLQTERDLDKHFKERKKSEEKIESDDLDSLQRSFGEGSTCVSPELNAFGSCCVDPSIELLKYYGGLKDLSEVDLKNPQHEKLICAMWAPCCEGRRKYDNSYYDVLCCKDGKILGATLADVTPRKLATIPKKEDDGLHKSVCVLTDEKGACSNSQN